MKSEIGDVEDTSGKHSSELFVRVRTGAVLTVIGIIVLGFSHIQGLSQILCKHRRVMQNRAKII